MPATLHVPRTRRLTLSLTEWSALRQVVQRAFSPREPIDNRLLLSGRFEQFARVLRVVEEPGAHAIVYGERGVGKTSFANCIKDFLRSAHVPFGDEPPVHVVGTTCGPADSFSDIWRRLFAAVSFPDDRAAVGFVPAVQPRRWALGEHLDGDFGGHEVARELAGVHDSLRLVFLVDEFNAAPAEACGSMAGTIKLLSDRGVRATVVFVGVANSVTALVRGHASVSRQLVEIAMPRMSPREMHGIITARLANLPLSMDARTANVVCGLSNGLPHYVHLLAQHAARRAVAAFRLRINYEDLLEAVDTATEEAQAAVREPYGLAVGAGRRDSLLGVTLTACALAPTDDEATFGPGEVRSVLERLLGRSVPAAGNSKRLAEFCRDDRGAVLESRPGNARRYRFRDAMLGPYVLMRSLQAGSVAREILDERGRPTGNGRH